MVFIEGCPHVRVGGLYEGFHCMSESSGLNLFPQIWVEGSPRGKFQLENTAVF